MENELLFRDLLNRALKGDQEACAELVNQLESVIRRAVRVHLSPRDSLRRLFDSWDISQSVLANLFVRLEAGAIEFRSPNELRRLLQKMTKDKVIDKRRGAQAECRDLRQTVGGSTILTVRHSELPPDEMVANRDLCAEARRRLTAREWQIVELWANGYTLAEIGTLLLGANDLPMTPDAVRMARDRALLRLREQLAKAFG
jgi:DNA-directed RNA polymerase specialized sigma24 family protein